MMVGLHGDLNSKENQATRMRVQQIADRRAQLPGHPTPLQVFFMTPIPHKSGLIVESEYVETNGAGVFLGQD